MFAVVIVTWIKDRFVRRVQIVILNKRVLIDVMITLVVIVNERALTLIMISVVTLMVSVVGGTIAISPK